MLLTEYNETRTMEMFKREGREEGRIEGRIEGREEGRVEGRKEGRKEGRIEGRKEGRIEGREEGRIEGRKEGRGEGEAKLGTLITRLISLGRTDDIAKAASDAVFRDKLYAEFGMA